MLSLENAEIIKFGKIDSTNLEANRILKDHDISNPLWIVAEEQSHGKGRMGNEWISIKGNLYASLIIPIACELKFLPMLSCSVALSVYDCIAKYLLDDSLLKIKWPNDILYDNSKLSGILIENIIGSNRKHSIIGIGININSSPVNVSHKTTFLNEIKKSYEMLNVKEVFETLHLSLEKYFNSFKEEKLKSLKHEFTSKAWKINEIVKFKSNNRLSSGRLEGFTDKFEIMINIEGDMLILNSGELSFNY